MTSIAEPLEEHLQKQHKQQPDPTNTIVTNKTSSETNSNYKSRNSISSPTNRKGHTPSSSSSSAVFVSSSTKTVEKQKQKQNRQKGTKAAEEANNKKKAAASEVEDSSNSSSTETSATTNLFLSSSEGESSSSSSSSSSKIDNSNTTNNNNNNKMSTTSSGTSAPRPSTATARPSTVAATSSSSDGVTSSIPASTTAAAAAAASASVAAMEAESSATATASAAAASTSTASVPTVAAAASATASSSSVPPPVAPNSPGVPTEQENISYSAERIIGNGSFGVVFEAKVVETNEVVAIKKVLQDKRFKNRELQIMRQLVKDPHTNIVALKHCFYSQGEKPDELYLNLVLEYVAETVYSISKRHHRHNIPMPIQYVKLYLYQLSRALAHIHALGICHRDIKPQNLLVNPKNQQLKLCDFGSAKALVRGEPNVSYICSRYYRAPELIFGSTDYTTAIDVWSQGCVGAELLLGQPLFPGDSGVDQLVEIIKVLGTPTKEEIRSMNSNYIEFKFPQIKGCQWKKIFRSKTPDEAMDFIARTLAYTPAKRLDPLEGCAHPFFDELREQTTELSNGGGSLPPLFDWTHHEMRDQPLLDKLWPQWSRSQQNIDGEKKMSSR